ncbi:unnamed protein product, partial [Symbiodinium sp. KB8]
LHRASLAQGVGASLRDARGRAPSQPIWHQRCAESLHKQMGAWLSVIPPPARPRDIQHRHRKPGV